MKRIYYDWNVILNAVIIYDERYEDGVYMKFSAVLFDYGNTLLTYADHSIKGTLDRNISGIKKILSSSSHPLPELHIDDFLENFRLVYNDVNKTISKTMKEVSMFDVLLEAAKRSSITMPRDDMFGVYTELYKKSIGSCLIPDPDAIDVLKSIKNAGMKTGLVSNSMYDFEFHLDELQRFGFKPLLDTIIISSSVGVRKPHKRIFDIALKELNVFAKDTLFVGDHLNADIEGASRAGMETCLKIVEHNDGECIVEPDYRINGLKELRQIL